MGLIDGDPHTGPNINWDEVPQTIEQYASFTGAPMHRVLPADHPSRPEYHGQPDLSFPALPVPERIEKNVFRNIHPDVHESVLSHQAQLIVDRYGKVIVHEIIAATYTGNLTPEQVFENLIPDEQARELGSIALSNELEAEPLEEESEGKSVWWRHRYFLRAAGAAASMGLAGVMMLPIVAPPSALQKPQAECDPDPPNGKFC